MMSAIGSELTLQYDHFFIVSTLNYYIKMLILLKIQRRN